MVARVSEPFRVVACMFDAASCLRWLPRGWYHTLPHPAGALPCQRPANILSLSLPADGEAVALLKAMSHEVSDGAVSRDRRLATREQTTSG